MTSVARTMASNCKYFNAFNQERNTFCYNLTVANSFEHKTRAYFSVIRDAFMCLATFDFA